MISFYPPTTTRDWTLVSIEKCLLTDVRIIFWIVHFQYDDFYYKANYFYSLDTDIEPEFGGLAKYDMLQRHYDYIELGEEDVPLPECRDQPPHQSKENVGKPLADIEIKGFNIDDEIDALIGREK